MPLLDRKVIKCIIVSAVAQTKLIFACVDNHDGFRLTSIVLTRLFGDDYRAMFLELIFD